MAKLLASVNPFVRGLTSTERRKCLARLQRPTAYPSQRSLLLDLPPELRNRIYELVLVSPHNINIKGTDNIAGTMTRRRTKAKESKAVIIEPALLRTCQLIRNEATQMYYASNTFECRKPVLLCPWLKGISATKRAMLTDVRGACHIVHDREIRIRMIPNFNGIYGFALLVCLDVLEEMLAVSGTSVGAKVLRIYMEGGIPSIVGGGSGTALTRSELTAKTTEGEWTLYTEYVEEQRERREQRRSNASELEGP